MGQISPDSAFGKAIADVVRRPSIKTICEVGAWNGQGTTACIYNGFGSQQKQLYSIEGDPYMFQFAERRWKGVPGVHLLHGTLHRNIMSREAVLSHPLCKDIVRAHYDMWYDTEEKTCQTAPLVEVPKCDCIVLDGGEFSTLGDWNVLYHSGLKAIILDDTQVIKTNGIYNLLQSSSQWKCTHDFPKERNGSAIFQKTHSVFSRLALTD